MHATLAFLLARVLWTLPLASVCLWAFVRGGGWERLVAAALVVGDIVSLLVLRPQWRHLTAAPFTAEALFWLVLYVSALRSDRWWPMAAASAKTLGLLMFLASKLNGHIWLKAYYFGNLACDYLVLAALAFGVGVEARAAQSRMHAAA